MKNTFAHKSGLYLSTQLYNQFFNEPASQLAKLHAQLDRLVCKAYDIKANDDVLNFLLALNFEVAKAES